MGEYKQSSLLELITNKNVRLFAEYLIPISFGAILIHLLQNEKNSLVLFLSIAAFFVYFFLLHARYNNLEGRPVIKLVLLFFSITLPLFVMLKADSISIDAARIAIIGLVLISYILIENFNLQRILSARFFFAFLLGTIFVLLIALQPLLDLGNFTILGTYSVLLLCYLFAITVIQKVSSLNGE